MCGRFSRRALRTVEECDGFRVASSKFKHLDTDHNLAVDIGCYWTACWRPGTPFRGPIRSAKFRVGAADKGASDETARRLGAHGAPLRIPTWASFADRRGA